MTSPTTPPEKGVPLGRILLILSVFAIPGLIYLGVRRLGNYVKIVDIPIVGEWQASSKPWRIVFRPDKTLVSSTSPSQPSAPQAWTSGPGTYSVDYYGTLWVKLKDGKIYSAALAMENPTRFDLIDSDTLVPTVFEKVPPPTPTPPESPKESPG
ncbi:MAG: hypothetical protein M3178_10005 [Pseudomonadota bacterium]|nr:hypothetical protein [Pseudomonadota bacterium]